MLQSIFTMVENILATAGASQTSQDIVSTVFDGILKIIGM